MAWELLAMWAIVIVAVTWFVRDERRLKADARLAKAARYYAHAPKYAFAARTVPQPAAPKPRSGSLLRNDRAYFDTLISKRASR